MSQNRLPAPVEELKKTKEGQKWLKDYQEKHKVDIAQPGTHLFEKAWGGKVKKADEDRQKRESVAQQKWLESEEVRKYERQRQIENFKSKYH